MIEATCVVAAIEIDKLMARIVSSGGILVETRRLWKLVKFLITQYDVCLIEKEVIATIVLWCQRHPSHVSHLVFFFIRVHAILMIIIPFIDYNVSHLCLQSLYLLLDDGFFLKELHFQRFQLTLHISYIHLQLFIFSVQKVEILMRQIIVRAGNNLIVGFFNTHPSVIFEWRLTVADLLVYYGGWMRVLLWGLMTRMWHHRTERKTCALCLNVILWV